MLDPEAVRGRVRERLEEQRALVQSLLRLREQIRGSLIVRYGLCGKEACACRRGRRHGPYYVLSTRSAGRGGFAYLEGRRLEEARALVTRHRKFKAGMRRLRTLNGDLVKLLRRYQEGMRQRGGRRLGLSAET